MRLAPAAAVRVSVAYGPDSGWVACVYIKVLDGIIEGRVMRKVHAVERRSADFDRAMRQCLI